MSNVPSIGSSSSSEHVFRVYPGYDIDSRYSLKTGIVALPLTGFTTDDPAQLSAFGPNTVALVHLHKPYSTKVVSWEGERVGEWPSCPSTDTNSPNEILVRADVIGAAPKAIQGSQFTHTVSGEYYYACGVPLVPGSTGFAFGVTPDTDLHVYAGILPETSFREGIITWS